MQVEVVNWDPVLCKLRKSCDQLEPKLPILGPFRSMKLVFYFKHLMFVHPV